MPSLPELERNLADISKRLDGVAEQIRDLDLSPAENIRRIGEALTQIADVRTNIYERRPDLAPEYLKKR